MNFEFQYIIIILLTIAVLGFFALCMYLITTLKDLKITISKTNELLDQTLETEELLNEVLEDVKKVTGVASTPYNSLVLLTSSILSKINTKK